MRMKKLLGIRSVAPARPEMADNVNNSAGLNGKNRTLIICTVTMGSTG